MRAARRREAAGRAPQYPRRERRRPEQTPLHQLVRQHDETFVAEVGNASGGVGLPQQ